MKIVILFVLVMLFEIFFTIGEQVLILIFLCLYLYKRRI